MTKEYDKQVFLDALKATAEHRGTTEKIADIENIIKSISESSDLKAMWDKYRKDFAYAEEIKFEDIVSVVKELVL